MIETSQLQTLVAVSKAHSFSKAAEDLNVTQSAISQSIKNLESKLDIKIFKRAGKSVVLTPEGEKLYLFASQFLSDLRDTLDEIRNDRNEMRGKVRIGTLTGIGKSWLATELVTHAKENPDLMMSIEMGSHQELLKEFENNLLDILVLPEDDVPLHGEKEFFLEERSTLVFPKGFKDFSGDKGLTLSDLETLPVILFDHDDHLFFKWCRTKFKSVPKKLNTRFIVNSHGHMLQAVYEGLGAAVVPGHVLKRSYFKDKVETLGGEYEIPSGKLYIVYQKESENLVRIKNTVDRLLSHRDTFKI
jgi:DNA-binding transcriptional LysR family regulator